MFPHFELSNLIMVYLLGVVVVATRAGRGPTALASVLSVAAFDFFFVPPYLSFAVSDTEYLITFAVMLVVALVISGLTVRIRAQADRRARPRAAHAALYAMSRELATTRDVDGLLDTAVRHIADVFPGQVAVLLPGDDGRVAPTTHASRRVLDGRERAGRRAVGVRAPAARRARDRHAAGRRAPCTCRSSGRAAPSACWA